MREDGDAQMAAEDPPAGDQEADANVERLCEYCRTLRVQMFPPKRPLSPFIYFSQEVSARLAANEIFVVATQAAEVGQQPVVDKTSNAPPAKDMAQSG